MQTVLGEGAQIFKPHRAHDHCRYSVTLLKRECHVLALPQPSVQKAT